MASDNRPEPAAAPVRRTGRKLLVATVAMLVLLTLPPLAAWWLVGTDAGARAVASLATNLVPGIRIEGIEGPLIGPLRIARVTFENPEHRYALADLQLDWEPAALLRRHVHVRVLRVARLDVVNKVEMEKPPPQLPDTLALPFTIRIDRMQLDSGSKAPVELMGAAASLDYDGQRYLLALERLALRTAGADSVSGSFGGSATLGAALPYALDARLVTDASGSVEQQPFAAAGDVTLRGTLAELTASVDFRLRQAKAEARAEGSAVLRLFSAASLGAASLRVLGVDLAALHAGLPQTRLDLRLDTDAAGAGTLAITNHEPGLYDQGKLPARSLHMRIRQDGGSFRFERMAAALGGAQPAGALSGSGTYARGALKLDLATDALDLRRLDSRLRATRLSGTAAFSDGGERKEITLSLAEPVNREQLTLAAHAVLAKAAIEVDRAELKLGQAAIEATGRMMLDGTQAFRAQGRLSKFRPRELGDFPQLPPLLLNGSFTASGALAPTLGADLAFSLRDSQLSGQPLSGEGRAQLRADTLDVPNLLVILGPNRLTAQGALSERDSQLAFTISAPQLDQIGPGFSGSLEATGTARGTLARPKIHAEWKAAKVLLPGPVGLEASEGKADVVLDRARPFFLDEAALEATVRGLQSGTRRLATLAARLRFGPQPDAPLLLELDATGLAFGERKVERVTASATGMTAGHALDIAVAERRQRWTLRAAGGLSGLSDPARAPQWRGSIERFEGAGPFTARLAAPAPLLVSQQRVQLDRFRLEMGAALLDIDQFLREPERIASRGRIERLEVAKVLEFAGPAPAIATDLLLDGEWDLRLADTLAGKLSVRRRQGDITINGENPVLLGLRTLEASASAADGRLALQVLADGQQLGHIEISAGTAVPGRTNPFAIEPSAPVSGRANINVPSIGWIGPLLSPAVLAAGQLQGNVTLGGTFGTPRFAGQISGSALRLLFADLGVDLRQGVLEGELSGSRLLLKRLQFQSANGGTLSLAGPIDLAGGKPALDLALNATRFQLLDRSDRKLVLSGASQITLAGNKLRIGGTFDVDSGSFDIGRANAPALSDDVVIVGREAKAEGKLAAALDLRIRLGAGIALAGRGLDALLRGEIQLLNNSGEPLLARGTLNVAKGTYTAYGQALAIEQGLVRFTGPLGNPALDLLAMRREQEVAAGVSVRGTVLAPRITLVSEPSVPDAEKLSWLVLGRGLGSAGSGDLAALQSAAAALLTNSAANGVSSQIATAFGLDTLSVGTSEGTVQQRIVTLGKKISSRLYVSYQKGLETASNALLLRYTLSPRLTVEAETGTRSMLSLFYNITFD